MFYIFEISRCDVEDLQHPAMHLKNPIEEHASSASAEERLEELRYYAIERREYIYVMADRPKLFHYLG